MHKRRPVDRPFRCLNPYLLCAPDPVGACFRVGRPPRIAIACNVSRAWIRAEREREEERESATEGERERERERERESETEPEIAVDDPSAVHGTVVLALLIPAGDKDKHAFQHCAFYKVAHWKKSLHQTRDDVFPVRLTSSRTKTKRNYRRCRVVVVHLATENNSCNKRTGQN